MGTTGAEVLRRVAFFEPVIAERRTVVRVSGTRLAFGFKDDTFLTGFVRGVLLTLSDERFNARAKDMFFFTSAVPVPPLARLL